MKHFKNPGKIHRFMIELARNSPDIKFNTLADIGRITAQVIGRAKPFSRQYVKIMLDRWAERGAWEGFSKNRLTIRGKNSLNDYILGKSSKISSKAKSKLHALGIPTMLDGIRKQSKELALQRSIDWKNGLSVQELSAKWKIKEINNIVCRYRAKYPELFPYRQKRNK